MTVARFNTVVIDDAHKRYGTLDVLRGFAGTFVAGRVAAIVGPNGAGKTTLLRITAGLQFADSGTVSSQGGLYYGGFDMLPRTGSINALRRALGLDSIQGGERRLSVLSRGELQQAGLDAAFDLAPEVLLLDEPWTALEPDAREELNRRIRETVRGRIVICSSHDLDEVVRVADDVVFLANGVGTWKRRGDGEPLFDRNELMTEFRESKRR